MRPRRAWPASNHPMLLLEAQVDRAVCSCIALAWLGARWPPARTLSTDPALGPPPIPPGIGPLRLRPCERVQCFIRNRCPASRPVAGCPGPPNYPFHLPKGSCGKLPPPCLGGGWALPPTRTGLVPAPLSQRSGPCIGLSCGVLLGKNGMQDGGLDVCFRGGSILYM